jgi:hypothetical protein
VYLVTRGSTVPEEAGPGLSSARLESARDDLAGDLAGVSVARGGMARASEERAGLSLRCCW